MVHQQLHNLGGSHYPLSLRADVIQVHEGLIMGLTDMITQARMCKGLHSPGCSLLISFCKGFEIRDPAGKWRKEKCC